MKRQLDKLVEKEFDLVVVGAGIHGACAARDAALRGLRVALIDKGDLCGETSHNSLKIIHGGIRYLQHLNFKRTLESINEQKFWLRTAPHLVKPLPFLMPTYGHGSRSSEAMWCGIKLYETLGYGRNKTIPTERQIPNGKVISKKQCLEIAPDIDQTGLRGGAIWYDAQIEDPDKAVIQIAQHAAEHGAQIASYVRAEQILVDNQKIRGLQATDMLTGNQFTIKSKLILNAAGPWAGSWLKQNQSHMHQHHDLPLTKSMNIVTRQVFPNYAVGVKSERQSDSIVGNSKRLYFITPWKNRSIIGTTHFHYDGQPEEAINSIENTKKEITNFIDEINTAYSGLKLSIDDVLYCYQGLTPANDPKQHPNATRLHHSKVIDHIETDQLDGLISIISIKWTTARSVAKRAIDLASKKLNIYQPCLTHKTAIPDTSIYSLNQHSDTAILTDFVNHAVSNEMAVSFRDLLLRRTDAVMRAELNTEQISTLFQVMSKSLNWSHAEQNRQKELLSNTWLQPQIHQDLQTVLPLSP